MATTHIPLAQAGEELAGLVRRVLDGEEIIIDGERTGVALRRTEDFPRRSIEESLVRAKVRNEARGYAALMDPDFADDMREILAQRAPLDHSAWD